MPRGFPILGVLPDPLDVGRKRFAEPIDAILKERLIV
jgi:hypothetical protein